MPGPQVRQVGAVAVSSLGAPAHQSGAARYAQVGSRQTTDFAAGWLEC